jgi:hypothetical protein
VDRKRNELDQIGIGRCTRRVGHWQWLAFFEQQLRKIFHRACDHQPCIGQVESLRHCPRKIERLRNNHLARRLWNIERDVLAQHTIIIRHRTWNNVTCSDSPLS